MAIISSGQITIIDLYDAPSLNAWISASQPTTQTYNNTTQVYSPNYTSSAQVLTLNLTKAGSATTLLGANVSNIKWTKRVGITTTEVVSTTNTDNEFKSGTNHNVLTTKVDKASPSTSSAIIYRGLFADIA